MSSKSSSPGSTGSEPPPKEAILATYIVLGSLMSFLFGRTPGTVADMAELCPSIVVVCLFLVLYSIYDVMGTGLAKGAAGLAFQDYKDWPAKLPEEAYLAERAQMNQLEQMPAFLVGIFLFSFLVNGTVGAILGLVWVILRRMYASTYRASVGKKLADKGLAKFTVPCYFLVGTLLMGSAVQALRWIVVVGV